MQSSLLVLCLLAWLLACSFCGALCVVRGGDVDIVSVVRSLTKRKETSSRIQVDALLSLHRLRVDFSSNLESINMLPMVASQAFLESRMHSHSLPCGCVLVLGRRCLLL